MFDCTKDQAAQVPVSFHFRDVKLHHTCLQSWAGPSEPTCHRQQTPECSGLRHGIWRLWSKQLSHFAGQNLENLELSISACEKLGDCAAAACTGV